MKASKASAPKEHMTACGIDGCRNGWAVARRDNESISFSVVPHFADVLRLSVGVIAVDIPIGLPDVGSRVCDQQVRQMLGWPRRCSVFSAPLRLVLKATSWAEANGLRLQIEGKGITKQCWGIVPKIKEVDETLRKSREDQKRVYEVHPELCFWQLAGRGMTHRKKDRAGRLERLHHLKPFGVTETEILDRARSLHCKADDLIDALVALWTAERIVTKHGRGFPGEDRLDSQRLPMRIWA